MKMKLIEKINEIAVKYTRWNDEDAEYAARAMSKEWAEKWKAFRESTGNQAIQLSTPVTQELQDLINKQVKELDEWSAEACHL